MTTFLIIIGIIFVVVIYCFLMALNKDNNDLQGKSLSEKFKFIVKVLNEYAFNGQGEVIALEQWAFNLYVEDSNQIIQFYYRTGNLTIQWRYKYFQQEVVHSRQFNEVRNISIAQQQKIAESLIREMQIVVANHKRKIDGTSIPQKIAQKVGGISDEDWKRAGEEMNNPANKEKIAALEKFFLS